MRSELGFNSKSVANLSHTIEVGIITALHCIGQLRYKHTMFDIGFCIAHKTTPYSFNIGMFKYYSECNIIRNLIPNIMFGYSELSLIPNFACSDYL